MPGVVNQNTIILNISKLSTMILSVILLSVANRYPYCFYKEYHSG